MLGQLRPMLTRCVFISFACATALPALAAQVGHGPFMRPKIITAPRFVPQPVPGARIGDRDFDRDRSGAHRFRDRRGGLGIDYGSGAYPVPVPVQVPTGGEAPAASEPQGGYQPDQYEDQYRDQYRAGRTFPSGPQILILPDPPARRGAPVHPRRGYRSERESWRDAGETEYRSPPHHHAYRYRARRGHYYGCERYSHGYAPSYIYQPSPVALAPCEDAPHAPIYNTPCGVRPYQ
jgi:hypothetical protein